MKGLPRHLLLFALGLLLQIVPSFNAFCHPSPKAKIQQCNIAQSILGLQDSPCIFLKPTANLQQRLRYLHTSEMLAVTYLLQICFVAFPFQSFSGNLRLHFFPTLIAPPPAVGTILYGKQN